MTQKRRQTARIIWTAAIVVIVLFALNLVLAQTDDRRQYEGLPVGSTYSADPGGAELTYRLFDELGFNLSRHRRPMLPEYVDANDVDVIWHASSTGHMTVVDSTIDEIEWLDRWVREGGTLVLVDNPTYTPVTASSGTYATSYTDVDSLIQNWLDRLDISSGIREITSLNEGSEEEHSRRVIVRATDKADLELTDTNAVYTYKHSGIVRPFTYRFSMSSTRDDELEPILRDAYGTALVWARYGNGEVWLASDPYMFSNLIIDEADNSRVAVSMILSSRGGDDSTVLFDEYHLGFVQTRSVSDAAKTPLGRAILYIGLIMALALGTAGARFGPIRKPPGAIGVSQKAFVKALATLWQGAGAVNAAADALWRRYGSRQQVRRLGLDQELDHMRKSNPRTDDLLDVAKRLDS